MHLLPNSFHRLEDQAEFTRPSAQGFTACSQGAGQGWGLLWYLGSSSKLTWLLVVLMSLCPETLWWLAYSRPAGQSLWSIFFQWGPGPSSKTLNWLDQTHPEKILLINSKSNNEESLVHLHTLFTFAIQYNLVLEVSSHYLCQILLIRSKLHVLLMLKTVMKRGHWFLESSLAFHHTIIESLVTIMRKKK